MKKREDAGVATFYLCITNFLEGGTLRERERAIGEGGRFTIIIGEVRALS